MMTYETRTRAVNALRTTKARQIRYSLGTTPEARCANGVLCEEFGISTGWNMRDARVSPYTELAAFGIPYPEILKMNDGPLWGDDPRRHTFAEIADWLETQPVSDPPEIPDTVPAWVEELVAA